MRANPKPDPGFDSGAPWLVSSAPPQVEASVGTGESATRSVKRPRATAPDPRWRQRVWGGLSVKPGGTLFRAMRWRELTLQLIDLPGCVPPHHISSANRVCRLNGASARCTYVDGRGSAVGKTGRDFVRAKREACGQGAGP